MIFNKCLFCQCEIINNGSWNYCQTTLCKSFYVRYLLNDDKSASLYAMRFETKINNIIYTIDYDREKSMAICIGTARKEALKLIKTIQLNKSFDLIITPDNVDKRISTLLAFA